MTDLPRLIFEDYISVPNERSKRTSTVIKVKERDMTVSLKKDQQQRRGPSWTDKLNALFSVNREQPGLVSYSLKLEL